MQVHRSLWVIKYSTQVSNPHRSRPPWSPNDMIITYICQYNMCPIHVPYLMSLSSPRHCSKTLSKHLWYFKSWYNHWDGKVSILTALPSQGVLTAVPTTIFISRDDKTAWPLWFSHSIHIHSSHSSIADLVVYHNAPHEQHLYNATISLFISTSFIHYMRCYTDDSKTI